MSPEPANAMVPRPPTPKAPFLPSSTLTIRRVGKTEPASGITAYVFHDVLEELVFSSRYHQNQCLAGIITGGYYQGPAGRYIEARGFVQSQIVESALDFGHKLRGQWHAIEADPDLSEAGLIPLGYFLSRPRCGGKPGPFELILHLSFFNQPHHFGFVLDPISGTVGLYVQPVPGQLANVGFNLIEANREQQHGNSDGDSQGDPGLSRESDG